METKKKCSKCGKKKKISEFYFKNKAKGRLQPSCKICCNKASKQHFEDNKQSYRDRVLERKQRIIRENQQKMLEFFESHPCVDCGEDHPATLDFDHLKDKRATVSALLRGAFLWSEIEKEIRKCEVRCSNCHRKKTATELNWYCA